MARGRPKKVYNVEETVAVTVSSVKNEKDQLADRQAELLGHLTWLQTNKFQDIGQLEVALSQVNQRLTEL